MSGAKRLLTIAAVPAFPLLCHFAVARGSPAATALGIAAPIAVNLGLCALFGRTLAVGREPMIARFARLERGAELPPDLARHARILTALWTAFFALMAAISGGLAAWGSTFAWSLFTNVINYLLVALFFVAEYAYRRLRFRHYRHLSPWEIARRLHQYRPS
jgi:uncharacterized membrane protein